MHTGPLSEVGGEEVLFVLVLMDHTHPCLNFSEDVVMAVYFLAEA